MSTYSIQPVTREQAAQIRVDALRSTKISWFIAAISVMAAIVAFFYIYDDIAADGLSMTTTRARPAWIVFVVSAILFVGFRALSLRQAVRFRYRVTVPFSKLWVAGALAVFGCAVAALGWLLNAIGVHRATLGTVLRGVIVFGLVIVLLWAGSKTNLLFGRFENLTVRQTGIAWENVVGIVLMPGSAPGTVEVGVRLHPGSTVTPMVVRAGERLTDLPIRVVIREAKLNLDALHWMVNQTGRTDIDIVQRGPADEYLLRRSNTFAGSGWAAAPN